MHIPISNTRPRKWRIPSTAVFVCVGWFISVPEKVSPTFQFSLVTGCYGETITKSSENPCRKMHCEHISTKLLTRRQYQGVVSRKAAHQSELYKVTEFSNSSDSEESSWINILRNRKNRRRIKYRHRMKRSSSTRTIVSVNSDDNKRRRSSNSKCHKYAVFEVIIISPF